MLNSTRSAVTLAGLAVATLSLAALTFSARQQTADRMVLKLAHGLDTTHPVHIAMEFMAERLREKSRETMTIEIFPSEQLGSERECIEQVQLGSIDMTKASTAATEQFVPETGVFSLPYLFRDEHHYWGVLNGEIGREILDAGRHVGLHGLTYFDAGARSFYTKQRPIQGPSDLQGMKIRVQQSQTAMTLIETLGGAPTPIPWGELYTALQQGVVDGAENNPPSFYTSRHYEVCKYYSLDEHTLVPDILVISDVVWNNLSPDQQRHLAEAAAEASVYQRKIWAEQSAQALEALEQAGVEIIHPDKIPFADAVASMLSEQEHPAVSNLVERIQAR